MGGGWEKDRRKSKWLWGTKNDTMKEGKESKTLKLEMGGGEEDCSGYRAHTKEESKSHVCILRSPPKVKDFTSVSAAA